VARWPAGLVAKAHKGTTRWLAGLMSKAHRRGAVAGGVGGQGAQGLGGLDAQGCGIGSSL
jgi:hypothetical protein